MRAGAAIQSGTFLAAGVHVRRLKTLACVASWLANKTERSARDSACSPAPNNRCARSMFRLARGPAIGAQRESQRREHAQVLSFVSVVQGSESTLTIFMD
jgi:hypothetical protein